MKTVKKIIRRIRNYYSKIKHLGDKYIVVSLGENCLTDNVLSRNDLKTFSSPFSSGRSNIEYVLNFEKENYSDFLNPHYLNYELCGKKEVPRNKKYVETKNVYHASCMNGVEFTHHDVICNTKKRTRIAKRCARLQDLSNQNVVFVYHNRYCQETDKKYLISCFKEIEQIYELRNNRVQIYIFTQGKVSVKEDRKIECEVIGNIKMYTLYTLSIWEGDDEDIFWARCDDDLLQVMIDDIREHIKSTMRLSQS